jgi:hypothetical protein
MRKILCGFAAAFALLFITAPAAFAEAIECPLSQARRTISNDLPSGWWTTPIVSNLSETRVQEIGGETALVCVYGPSGSIQRNAPEGQTCTARTGGFDCRPRLRPIPLPLPTPAPRTHSTGEREVPQTYVIDLDSGAVGGGGDIWFHAVTNSELYIEPRGGAQMALGDGSNRGYAGCSGASYSTARAPLSAIPVGTYVCVRTNEGRISQFRMNAISSGTPKTLSIGYTTWR